MSNRSSRKPDGAFDGEKLKKAVEQRVARMKQADKERLTLLAQSAYIGVLGLIFVLPVIGGAYLGRWLDSLHQGYSIGWTLNMIILGLAIGAMNVYFFIKE